MEKTVDGYFLAIIDVLGHGIAANRVRVDIEGFFNSQPKADIAGAIQSLDEFLAGTIGAAAGFCHLAESSGTVTYAAIGNTSLRCFGETDRRLVTRDGVPGQNASVPHIESLGMNDGDVLLLHTDGVRTHFERGEYPQILSDDAQVIAKTVVERFSKPHDDAACIAARFHS